MALQRPEISPLFYTGWREPETEISVQDATPELPVMDFDPSTLLMPAQDIQPLDEYDRTMPLAQPGELPPQTLVEEPFRSPFDAGVDIAGGFAEGVADLSWIERTAGGIGSYISQAFADVWSTITGAPREEEWEHTSDYMAGSDDPRWRVLHQIPPIEGTYQAVHPEGYTPPELHTEGDDEMVMGGAGAPWGDYQEGDFASALGATRTDPRTGSQYQPGVPSQTTVLKTWWAGPRGGPRIRFVMFMQNGRKYIGCNKTDGSWKQWPAKHGTIVIGKTLSDAKARRVARRLERYSKNSRKILGLLGYRVTRK